MRTIKSLIEELSKFPQHALCYAYEGEIHGVVVVGPDRIVNPNGSSGRPQLGWVNCGEGNDEESETEIEEEVQE